MLYVCLRPVTAFVTITCRERPRNDQTERVQCFSPFDTLTQTQYISKNDARVLVFTGAECLVSQWVETPGTRPGGGDLEAAQHPRLVCHSKRHTQMIMHHHNSTRSDGFNLREPYIPYPQWNITGNGIKAGERLVVSYRGLSYWRGRLGVGSHSLEFRIYSQDTSWALSSGRVDSGDVSSLLVSSV